MPFTLRETVSLPDINSIGYLYIHDKTQSPVVYIANDDTNKAFSISFATPPYNDNGIAHILEHSVLCGSRKYPTKEPFVELSKGSLHTFLNAMTFSDKTMYPVASQNDKDFYHLTDVYLDAVFFPRLLQDSSVLAQEGWHYHLEDPADDLIYTGVVYNEMKGYFSDPETVINRAISSELFPDTIYRHESGGDPLAIPTLTQDEFVNFHQTYYHPSNAQTFLYGQLNIQEQLDHLDEYFEQFDYKETDNGITLQAPFENMRTVNLTYAIEDYEQTENKTFIGLDFVVGQAQDTEKNIQFSMLSDLLIGSNAAPLYRALLDANISSDIMGGFDAYTAQSTWNVMIKNSQPEHVETFKNIVFTTLKNIVENGFDEEFLQATLNRARFALKESSQGGYPKGVYYAVSSIGSSLYGGSPFAPFFIEKHLDKMTQNQTIFIDLIKNHLLDNPHSILTVAHPEKNANQKQFDAIHETLQTYKASLSTHSITELIQQTQDLITRQNTPDTPEALATIPVLSLADLSTEAKSLPVTVHHNDTNTFLHYDVFTSGIDYMSYHFNLEHLTLEQLQYASLIARLLTHLPTQTYTIDALSTQIDLHTGGLSFQTDVLNQDEKNGVFYPRFVVKGKAFTYATPKLLTLLHDILTQTCFTYPEKINEQLLKIKSRFERRFTQSAHSTAVYRLRSYYSQAGKLEDSLNGIDFYHFICDVIDLFQKDPTTVIYQLESVYQTLFYAHKLVGGWIGQSEDVEKTHALLESFASLFDATPQPKQPLQLSVEILNEGFSMAQDVQYVAKGFNVSKNFAFTGHIHVLKNVLSYSYLWNRVRVQGGAYGVFTIISRDGDFIFCSYRDPHLDNTLHHYDQAVPFIETLELDDRELTKAIIGTISDFDTPRSPKQLGEEAFRRQMLSITTEDVQEIRSAILSTTVSSLQHLASYVHDALSHQAVCVIGNQENLQQSKTLHTIKPLLH